MFFKITVLFGLILGALSSPIAETKGTFSDYFNAVQWISRNGEISLSIDHKWIQLWEIRDSFNILKSRYGYDSRWKNEDSLYAQYACHVQFVAWKNPWNLEPHRTDSSFWSTTFNGCNPNTFFKYFSESKEALN